MPSLFQPAKQARGAHTEGARDGAEKTRENLVFIDVIIII